MSRLMALLVLVASISGCKREPTFDERYDAATKTIVDRAKAIDAQVSGTDAPPSDASSAD